MLAKVKIQNLKILKNATSALDIWNLDTFPQNLDGFLHLDISSVGAVKQS